MNNDDYEQKKLAAQVKGVKAANSVLNVISSATHYGSYHAYRRSLRIITYYVMLAFVIGVIGIFPFSFNRHGFLTSLSGLMLIIYFFAYYWVIAKSRTMKKDSHDAMMMAAVNGFISDSWRIYDGIFDIPGNPNQNQPVQESLEVAFTRDNSYLKNIIWIIRGHKPSLPPKRDDIENLKAYLAGLQKISTDSRVYVAYATMPKWLANDLSRQGIILTPIAHKYVTVPGRWDYAGATGRMANAIWGYPLHFDAYAMQVDLADIANDEKQLKVEHQKKSRRNKKMRKLKRMVEQRNSDQ